jgi:hypothetical protein
LGEVNMLKLRRSWLTRYGAASLLVIVATGLRLYIGKQAPLVPFIIAVMLSAWFGDLGRPAERLQRAAREELRAFTPQYGGENL